MKELVLRPGSTTFEWWARPPVRPFVNVYVYNVTNADEFLNNGSKPVLNELGPYVYSEEWEKVNIVDNEDGTISFRYKRTYTFQPELSIGADNDMVVVPNIPMLSATSQSKHASMFLRLALASVMDILKIKPFVEVSVGQLLWGYEDPFLRLAKDVVPKEQRVPYEEFGLFYGKNSTSPDVVTMFNGATNTSLYGIIDRYDTKDKLSHWTNERCNSIAGSDGWIFPPHINKNDTLEIYDKDFCRLLPLKYLHDVESASGLHGYRFTPPEDVFANNEANECFCPDGAPCAPDGLFNVTLCRYDSPIMLSFPHFYLADPKLLDAVEGISPPVAEKHRFYIDVKPEIGIAIQARARIQINLAVSRVTDIKQLANFPDIVFPIMWYEEGIDESPSEVTSLLPGATKVPLSRDRLQEEELVLRPGSTTFEWWARPPVRPFVNVYVYNVTNADEFLNNGSKPVLNELGPYVYSEEWEKVNIVDNGDGTISFRYKRTYTFQPELSIGADDDMVVVPNIPMLSSTSQSKHVARFLRLALASIMDILNIKPFVEVSVSQLLWGYEDPLLKVAKDVVPKEQKLPYEEFGLFYGKNGTSPDVVKMFTGATNTSLYGIIDRYDMKNKLSHWTNERCNSIAGSDGWIFPPHINKNDTLEIYDKDFCRLLPLKYLHDVEIASGLHGYRFTPPEDVFANNEANECFCPDGAPCAPDGLFNVTLCRYDSPIMLSFPHFYLADPKLLDTVEGISPPVPEKHRFYIDVQPEIGIAIQARARIQINLAVSRVTDIKQLANFPDIVFPIMWYEEGIDELPSEVTPLLPMATKVSRDRLQEEVPQFSVSSLHSLSKEVPHQIVTPPKNFTTEGTLGGETTIP